MRNFFKTDRTVLLIGAGEIDENIFYQEVKQSEVVAVDGGVNWLEDRQIEPSWALGDGDSVSSESAFLKAGGFYHLPEQETTDMEKALTRIEAPRVIGLGFLGDRLDHAFCAIHILAKLSHHALLVGKADVVVVIKEKQCRFRLPIGARVSVVPLPEAAFISSTGLVYPLDGLRLRMGDKLGTSNENYQEEVQIDQSIDDQSIDKDTIHHQGYALLVEKKYYRQFSESLNA